MNKLTIVAAFAASSLALSGQSFVAGWDFDDVGVNDQSVSAQWGLETSATLSWTHALANFPITFTNDFDVNAAYDQAVVNNSFSFLAGGIDTTTGFNEFSDNDLGSTAKQGIAFTGSGDVSISFDASSYSDLSLVYALDGVATTVDLSAYDGLSSAVVTFSNVSGVQWDNVAVTGTVVPEPSTYAAIFGVIALVVTAIRRRK